MPRFKHKHLHNPLTQIRLLQLLPYNEDRDIRCSLETHELDRAPPYTALSYECGPLEPTVDILVEGHWFSIRHNLWLFLSQLKEKHQNSSAIRDTLIWADAICISQLDLWERNAQVGIMGSIFHRATSTYAWLGWPLNVDAASLFKFLRSARPPPPTQNNYANWQHNIAGYAKMHLVWLKQALALCEQSYFKRRWVIQELLLSQNVMLIWGEAELPWSIFLVFLHEIAIPEAWWSRMQFVARPAILKEIDATLAMEIASWVGKFGRNGFFFFPASDEDFGTILDEARSRTIQRVSLLKLLCDFRDTQCEHPSDRVYSMLSLSQEYMEVKVDYSMSAELRLCHILKCTRWSDLHDVRLVVDALQVRLPTLSNLYSGQVRPLVLTNLTFNRLGNVKYVFSFPGTIDAARQDLTRALHMESSAGTESMVAYKIKRSHIDHVVDTLDNLSLCMTALAEAHLATSTYSIESHDPTSATSVTSSQVHFAFTNHPLPAQNNQWVPYDVQLLVCDTGSLAVCRCPARIEDVLCVDEAGTLHVVRPTASKSQLVGDACVVLGDVHSTFGDKALRRSFGPRDMPSEVYNFESAAHQYMAAHEKLPRRRFSIPNYEPLEAHWIIYHAFQSAEKLAIVNFCYGSEQPTTLEALVDVWDAIRLSKEPAFTKSQIHETHRHRHRRKADNTDARESEVLGILLGESNVDLSQNSLDSRQIEDAREVGV